jgi:hypothetical protein
LPRLGIWRDPLAVDNGPGCGAGRQNLGDDFGRPDGQTGQNGPASFEALQLGKIPAGPRRHAANRKRACLWQALPFLLEGDARASVGTHDTRSWRICV